MNFKYIIGTIISLPLLPILYFQGKIIKKKVPVLPEAKGKEGMVESNSDRRLRLLTIGESTIAGVGVDTQEEGFTGTLAKALAQKIKTNIHWKVYAKSGYTVKQIKNKIIPTISEEKADLIVAGIGANDAFTVNTPSKFIAHLQEMIDAIRSKFGDTPIVFMNMPPIKEFPAFVNPTKFVLGNLIEIFGEEVQKVVQKNENIFYCSEIIRLDKWKKRFNLTGDSSVFFSDGVHPSKLTYQVWAGEMANYIVKNSKIMGLASPNL